MMKSNMVLTADFETNRFIGLSGTYWGLFADNPVAQQSAGMFKIKVYSKQTFDGALYMQGGSLSISGGKLTLDGNGVCSVIKRDTKGKANMQVAIQLSFNSDVIQGTVTCFSNTVYAPEDGPFTAAMFGYKEGFNATNPTTAGTLAGLYNMALAIPTSPESPKGYGWLTLTVKTNGQAVPGSGKLGDNTAMAFKTATISKDGYWPFYVESAAYKENFTYYDLKGAYKTNKEPYGMAMGWMKFEGSGVTRTLVDNIPWGDPVQGGVHWIRKYAYGTNQFYPSGFTNWNLAAWGSPYVKPANTATDRALNLMSGSVEHADGDVDLGGFTNLFTQAVANKIVLTPPIASAEGITISTTKGQFSSSFYNTNVSVTKKTSASGVILQDENIARGVFSGSSASGSMLIK
jgi:hypothetical protein